MLSNPAPLVAIIGLLFFFLADVPRKFGRTGTKLVRVGELMFFAGLLATLMLRIDPFRLH